ncbi:hypothetical protein VTJ83DRAFT_2958 [Remersonia thermophila]|uniref:Integral membrane protein n=1 Tax=Remersonia thermophila TaxID=72144 RepID=A0ABR4DEW4_9PEZI
MKAHTTSLLPGLAGAGVVLALAPAVLAQSHEHGGGHGHGGAEMTDADKPLPEDQYPPTYFSHPDHKAVIYGHIVLMTLAWVFALPAAVMLSLARSRYTLLVQFAFLGANAGAVLLGVVYNASTPDLYPNNAHGKVGWIAALVVSAQVVVGLLARVAGAFKRSTHRFRMGARSEERQGFLPVSTEAMAEHDSCYPPGPYGRFSQDSGQGTEPRTESLRSQPLSSPSSSPRDDGDAHKEYRVGGDGDDNNTDDDLSDAHVPIISSSGRAYAAVARVAEKISDRFWKVLLFAYNAVDRTILILGFIALCTGITTYGRFFEGSGIYSGLAHFIKGGVFFWLGIFTLGRWAGCFGELGWAWNVRPKVPGQKWKYSAEFVESFLIFFYGSTNIFLEHLGGWGGEWTASDLEHISITVLFIGGGLCGMLVESVKMRNLLNYAVSDALCHPDLPASASTSDVERGHRTTTSTAITTATDANPAANTPDELREPDTYAFSANPIPALVIFLLGLMMSSHTQASMISSMVHKQWGNLLAGAAFARALTYVVLWLRPPRSVYPSRPPTELLASFGLMGGGVIFMSSAHDVVQGMIHYRLDAMFMYTVTMGLVGLLMAYTLLMIALKGWAARREAAGRV